MKKPVLTILSTLIFVSVLAQQPLNVMTFNIRLDTPRDSANAWPFRKDKAASQILFHEAHIIGVQEAFNHQLKDLKERLPHYAWVGAGRDDGKEKGEYSAIIYDSSRIRVLQSETFWLSPTPHDAGVKGWDAAFPRVVTWAQVKDLATNKQFYVFNTHFDHVGKVARAESARMLMKAAQDLAGTLPCIILGDFNASPDQEPIKIIMNPGDPLRFTDSKAISSTPHYGPEGTFNGFQSKETTDQPIDFIFIKNGPTVLKHATLSQSWGGKFASDHFAVFARVVIP
jgi:endonuclease/exonuclease/phosphatase family metal-dependent hydrolase